MIKVNRIDIGTFDEPELTPQGFLKIPVLATRSGIFIYETLDGEIFRELRPPENVFDKNSMYSFSGIPVTDDHPPVMLNSENTKNYQVGFTGDNVEKNGDYIRGKVTLTDASTIKNLLETKKREVSCGYSCILDYTPGQYNGESYDAIQTNIVYNHLSIVDAGRAGPNARLQMDRKDAMMIVKTEENNNKENTTDNKTGGKVMVKIKIDGIEYEASEGLAQAVREQEKSFDKVNVELDANKKTLAELSGKVDGMTSELKKKDEEIEKMKAEKVDNKALLKIAKDRAELEAYAEEVLGKDEKIDEKSNIDIKKAIIAKSCTDIKIDEKDDMYIEGCFSALSKTKTSVNNDALKAELEKKAAGNSDKTNEVITDSDIIRKKKMEEASELYKGKK